MSELLQLFDLLSNRPDLLAAALEHQDHASLERLKSTLLDLSRGTGNALDPEGGEKVVSLKRGL